MTKEQAFDILKDAFNEYIGSYDPENPSAAYDQFSVKVSGTFVEAGHALVGPIPDLPIVGE